MACVLSAATRDLAPSRIIGGPRVLCITDNPNNEITYYPDPNKWQAWPPHHLFRMAELPLDEVGYFEGEQ